MQDNNIIDTSELVTAAEVGKMKNMQSNLLAYHLAKPDAPKPVQIGIGKHPFYYRHQIEAWQPNRDPSKKRKNRNA